MFDPLSCKNKNSGDWKPHQFAKKPDAAKSASNKKQFEADSTAAQKHLVHVGWLKPEDRFTLKQANLFLKSKGVKKKMTKKTISGWVDLLKKHDLL